MIQPVNGHILIDPLAQDGFIASARDTYQEIGTVVATPDDTADTVFPSVGSRVFFDSWLAVKYPKAGTTDGFYWLVQWSDVRAVEYDAQPESL